MTKRPMKMTLFGQHSDGMRIAADIFRLRQLLAEAFTADTIIGNEQE